MQKTCKKVPPPPPGRRAGVKSNPIPVRFEAADDDQLAALAKRTGLPQAQLVRLAVKLFVRCVKKTGTIPLQLELD